MWLIFRLKFLFCVQYLYYKFSTVTFVNMKITPHDFKKIRSCLKDHDISKVVERSRFSKVTIYNALRGDAIDRTTRRVVEVCLEVIKENEIEARKTVESISKKLK